MPSHCLSILIQVPEKAHFCPTHYLSIVIQVSQKASKKHANPRSLCNEEHTIWIHARTFPVLPGFARDSVDRDLGSKLYLPHAPTSQSATRPLGRQLAYQIRAQTLAGSHHIACKLHAITKDYHPPGRHQNRIFRVLQPFRAKTLIFMKKAIFTSGAALVRHLGSLLSGGS